MNSASPYGVVAVIGAGSWGAALARLCLDNGARVMIWARDPDFASQIAADGENKRYLPGVSLDGVVAARTSADLADADAALYVAPAQAARGLFATLASAIDKPMPVAICAKGVERGTGALMPAVLSAAWPAAIPAILSGPSFAKDVAEGRPTAVTFGCRDAVSAARWAATLNRQHFRLYSSEDMVGVALGGAIKNVLAIAAGAVDGAGLGESARAAVISRGFAEFQRLGKAMGASSETMAGLSGLGDLILTATSPTSRNMSLGRALGEGAAAAAVLRERASISEGAATADAICLLADQYDVEMPISRAVADLVSGVRALPEIVVELLARPPRAEG